MTVKFIRYSDFVAGAKVVVEHNTVINSLHVEIESLCMDVRDWEMLQQRVNEMLVEAGYFAKGSSVVQEQTS